MIFCLGIYYVFGGNYKRQSINYTIFILFIEFHHLIQKYPSWYRNRIKYKVKVLLLISIHLFDIIQLRFVAVCQAIQFSVTVDYYPRLTKWTCALALLVELFSEFVRVDLFAHTLSTLIFAISDRMQFSRMTSFTGTVAKPLNMGRIVKTERHLLKSRNQLGLTIVNKVLVAFHSCGILFVNKRNQQLLMRSKRYSWDWFFERYSLIEQNRYHLLILELRMLRILVSLMLLMLYL